MNIHIILTECRNYIDAIEDFDVNLLGDIVIEGNNTTQYFNSFNAKEKLIKFTFSCEEKSTLGKVSLLNYIEEYAKEWGDIYTKNVTHFDREISYANFSIRSKTEEAAKNGYTYYHGEFPMSRIKQLEDRKQRYQLFHKHNYNLIILIRSQVYSLPFPEHLNHDLEQLGIELITKNTSPTENTSSSYTPPSFDSYIKENFRVQLMPYLISKYRDKKPKEVVPMLYALEELGIISGKVIEHSQTDLHNALTVTFGSVGGRTALNNSLHKYWLDQKRPDLDRKRQIEMHKTLIADLLRDEKSE